MFSGAHSSPGITPPGITFQSVITRLIRYHLTFRIRYAVSLASICLFAELLLFYVLLKHYMVSSHLIHKSLILSVFKRYTNESFFLLSLIRTMTLGKTQCLFSQSEYNHSCLSCPYHFRDTRWIGKIIQMGLYTHSHACTWKT